MNRPFVFGASLVLAACFTDSNADGRGAFVATPITSFEEPWAMSFLPDGRLLVTEKKGHLLIVTQGGDKSEPLAGVPDVDYGGQGGFGDVVLHPDFASNGLVYVSFVEAGQDDVRGAVVARARLILDSDGGGQLDDLQIIWRQHPKVKGKGHYGHRMVFSDDGYLYISSGERKKLGTEPSACRRTILPRLAFMSCAGSNFLRSPDDMYR